mmetsp:Transcript_13051/g.30657  ORF Transcript_13051/g.30657 Transcript_13051/m.30657 type:complete len:253 (-) Transcript_13051:1629-2387(-)
MVHHRVHPQLRVVFHVRKGDVAALRGVVDVELDRPTVDEEHGGAHLPLVEQELARIDVERPHLVDDLAREDGRRLAQEGAGQDQVVVLLVQHFARHRLRQARDDVGRLVEDRGLLVEIFELLSYPLGRHHRKAAVAEVLLHSVHLLAVEGGLHVDVLHHDCHVTDHVTEHGRAHQHPEDRVDALGVVRRVDIAVAHGRHGGEGPVDRVRILERYAHVLYSLLKLAEVVRGLVRVFNPLGLNRAIRVRLVETR